MGLAAKVFRFPSLTSNYAQSPYGGSQTHSSGMWHIVEFKVEDLSIHDASRKDVQVPEAFPFSLCRHKGDHPHSNTKRTCGTRPSL